MESVSTIYLLQIEKRAKTPEGAVAQPVHADTMHGVTRFLQSDIALHDARAISWWDKMSPRWAGSLEFTSSSFGRTYGRMGATANIEIAALPKPSRHCARVLSSHMFSLFFQVFLACIFCEFSTLISIDFLLGLLQPFGHDPTAQYHCRGMFTHIYIYIHTRIYIFVYIDVYFYVCIYNICIYIYIADILCIVQTCQTIAWKSRCTLCISISSKFREAHTTPALFSEHIWYDTIVEEVRGSGTSQMRAWV